jgi:hypothetical protein
MSLDLPSPFESAHDLEPDAFGRVTLVEEDGTVLAHLPLETAHAFSSEQEYDPPEGYLDGSGDGLGSTFYDSGYGFDCGGGSGQGYGVVYGYGYGNGEGCGEDEPVPSI